MRQVPRPSGQRPRGSGVLAGLAVAVVMVIVTGVLAGAGGWMYTGAEAIVEPLPPTSVLLGTATVVLLTVIAVGVWRRRL